MRGLEMNDIKIKCQKEDARPAFVLDDVKQADFFHINAPRTAANPVFVLNNVEDFSVTASPAIPDTRLQKAEKKEI